MASIVIAAALGSFGLAAQPVTANVSPGGSTNYVLTITPNGGFGTPIGFEVRNLPPFTSANVVAQSATSATIQVTTSATTPAGTFPLLITGTSGQLSATVQVSLTVVSP